MEKVAKIENDFLRQHMKFKCKCIFHIHIQCYNNWRLYTIMICPICRITEEPKKIIHTDNSNILFYFFVLYVILIIMFKYYDYRITTSYRPLQPFS